MTTDKLYRDLVESNSHFIILILDLDGKIQSWNQGATKHLLYDKDEALGKHVSFLHLKKDESAGKLELMFRECKNNGFHMEETELARKDGSTVWVQSTFSTLVNDQGKLVGYSKISNDMTDIKQREMKMEEVSQFNKSILENSPLGISAYNDKGQCVMVNSTAVALSGGTTEQILGSNFRLQKQTLPPEIFENLEKTLKTGEQTHCTLEGINRFKKYLALRCNFFHVAISGVSHVVLMFTDISELKQALAESQLYRSALDQSAIVRIADKDYEVTEVNELFLRVSGMERSEIIGQKISALLTAYHTPEFVQELKKTVASGKIWRGETCYQKKSGNFYWADTTIIPFFDRTGVIEKFLSVSYEITEKKQSQAVLMQTAKIASLGEMAGGLAHEINNPLAIIQGKVEQVLHRVQSEKPDLAECVVELKKIIECSERIARIVAGLKFFSGNPSQDKLSKLSLSKIVERALELYTERFKSSAIDLRVKVDPKIVLLCRPAQITHVLINLLNNAFDAVQSLAEKWIEISCWEFENKAVLSVADSGKGIPADIALKIMQPFFTTKEIGKGMGLGLSLSKGIIENHKGRFFLDRASPHTKFIVELPLSTKG